LTTFTEPELERNMRAVAHAVAQQELEGLRYQKPLSRTCDGRHAEKSPQIRLSVTFTPGLSMSQYSGHDHYLDPASGVLINCFGITDAATLEATEADLVAARSRDFSLPALERLQFVQGAWPV
jgi:hypothetical protein